MLRNLHARISVITVVALCAGIVWACLHRGPWYDEFYTQYVTRGSLPWIRAFREAWLADNHPPFFYILARATNGLGDIANHRLLNLGVALMAITAIRIIVRDVPRLIPASTALGLVLCASYWTILSASELRSYFISLCAGTTLALGLCAIRITGNGGSRARRCVYALSSILVFNTHIITSLTAVALVTPFLAEALIRREWTQTWVLAWPPLIGGLVFSAISLVQLPLWLAGTQVFWIAPGFDAARWSVEYAVLRMLEANLLILLCSLIGTVAMLHDAWEKKGTGPHAAQARSQGVALLLLATGVVLAIAGLIALHMWRPILIEKYLTAMMGAIAVGLALACGYLLQRINGKLSACVLVASFILAIHALIGNVSQAVARHSWFGTGRAIAAQVAQCPATIIHTDPYWNAEVMAMMPRDNAQVPSFAYRYVAHHFRFALAPDGSKAMSRTCPTLFWAEHDTRHRFTREMVLAHLRASGFAVRDIELRTIGDGWIAVAAPQT